MLLVSFLLSVCIRKTKVKGVGLNLQHILQVNKEYGIKKSKSYRIDNSDEMITVSHIVLTVLSSVSLFTFQ